MDGDGIGVHGLGDATVANEVVVHPREHTHDGHVVVSFDTTIDYRCGEMRGNDSELLPIL